MRLTKKLLGFLNRVFNKEPDEFLAFRLSHVGGAMTWRVQDAVLTTTLPAGAEPGAPLTIDLTKYTIGSLINYLAAQPGYLILYGDTTDLSTLSARVLIDGGNNVQVSNGDHVSGYQSPLWVYMEAAAKELDSAAYQIQQMLLQMSTKTAKAEWLDEIGGYYGIPRFVGESDALYGPRIISETLRPRGNNVAMQNAIKDFTGQFATVTDVTLYTSGVPTHAGTITHNAAFTYSAGSNPVYGLFDVQYGYDLINGGDVSAFSSQVRALIDRLRDAGTHLRALNLGGSALVDDLTPPTDGAQTIPLAITTSITESLPEPTEDVPPLSTQISAITESLSEPTDHGVLSIVYGASYGGLRNYDASRVHQGGNTLTYGGNSPDPF